MKERTRNPGHTVSGNESCKHWDVIESPHGDTATGRCKFCGREKLYDTSYGYSGGRFEKMVIRPSSDAFTSLPFQVMK